MSKIKNAFAEELSQPNKRDYDLEYSEYLLDQHDCKLSEDSGCDCVGVRMAMIESKRHQDLFNLITKKV